MYSKRDAFIRSSPHRLNTLFRGDVMYLLTSCSCHVFLTAGVGGFISIHHKEKINTHRTRKPAINLPEAKNNNDNALISP